MMITPCNGKFVDLCEKELADKYQRDEGKYAPDVQQKAMADVLIKLKESGGYSMEDLSELSMAALEGYKYNKVAESCTDEREMFERVKTYLIFNARKAKSERVTSADVLAEYFAFSPRPFLMFNISIQLLQGVTPEDLVYIVE